LGTGADGDGGDGVWVAGGGGAGVGGEDWRFRRVPKIIRLNGKFYSSGMWLYPIGEYWFYLGE